MKRTGNPYELCWDDPEDDPDADPTNERLGPNSPEPPHGSISTHGMISTKRRTSMHYPQDHPRYKPR